MFRFCGHDCSLSLKDETLAENPAVKKWLADVEKIIEAHGNEILDKIDMEKLTAEANKLGAFSEDINDFFNPR